MYNYWLERSKEYSVDVFLNVQMDHFVKRIDVTRFKLIKSGKHWLRAATSNLGLFKVVRGQVEELVVAEVAEEP